MKIRNKGYILHISINSTRLENFDMPHDTFASKFYGCCGTLVCRACFVRSSSNLITAEGYFLCITPVIKACPFCRSSDDIIPFSRSHLVRRQRCLEARAEKGDSRAVLELAWIYRDGFNMAALANLPDNVTIYGILANPRKTHEGKMKELEYLEKAASMGNSQACYELAISCRKQYNAVDFLGWIQKAADLGDFKARDELASLAIEMNQFEIAMSHYKILAAEGYAGNESLDKLADGYEDGYVTKNELESAILAYNSARKELCSKERIQLDRSAIGPSNDGNSMHRPGRFL